MIIPQDSNSLWNCTGNCCQVACKIRYLTVSTIIILNSIEKLSADAGMKNSQ